MNMNFLDLFRKLGIYRSGVAKWSGAASERKMEFIQNGVFNSQKDNLNNEDMKQGGLIQKIILWIVGILGALFIFTSISFSFVFLGNLVIWCSLFYYIKKFKYSSWKIILVLILCIIISLIMTDSSKTYDLKIVKGNTDQKILLGYNNSLVKLILDYKTAAIDTFAITSVKFGSMSLDKYTAFLKKTETEWQTVAYDADALGNFLQYAPVKKVSYIEKTFSLIKTAFADEITPIDFKSGDASEVGVQQQITDWDRVDVYKQVLPDKNILKATQTIFKTTAQDAKVILETHGTQMSKIYNNEADFYKTCSNTARTIGTASKVILYFAGFAVAGPAATIGAEAMQATTVAVGGVDAALDIGETTAIVALGNEDTPPIIQKVKDKLYWVSTILAIKDLKLNLSAEDASGNISTIGGLVNDGVNAVIDYKGDTVQVKTNRVVSPITRDTLIENVYPSDLVYEKKTYEDLVKEQVKNNSIDPEYKEALDKLQTEKTKLLNQQNKSETTAQLEPVKPVTTNTPTPIDIPVLVTPPAPTAGSVVGTCGACFQNKLDCVCGRAACKCCAPNDSGCNAYDL